MEGERTHGWIPGETGRVIFHHVFAELVEESVPSSYPLDVLRFPKNRQLCWGTYCGQEKGVTYFSL